MAVLTINSIYGLTASGLYGTQEEIDHGPVQQYGTPKFKAGKALKDSIN